MKINKKRISKIYQISDVDFCKIIKTSFSYSDCLRKIGLKTNGGSSVDILKERIKQLNCSTKHFNPYKSANNNMERKSLEDILVENSSYKNITRLKKRLLQEGLLEYKCQICGNLGIWNGKELSLQLDHVNGVNNDNRLSNLRFLCPNCHSQTETYAGKNRKKK